MSDPGGQRPRYGEYATPEEQRAHIREPDPALLQPPPHPEQATSAAPGYGVPAGPPPRAMAAGGVDRLVTFVLLGFGLVNVVLSLSTYADLPSTMSQAMKFLDVTGSFTDPARVQVFGYVAGAVLVVGYLLTAVLTFRRLRTGRLTWWVPLVGAVVTLLVVYAIVMAALLSDPGFMTALTPTAPSST